MAFDTLSKLAAASKAAGGAAYTSISKKWYLAPLVYHHVWIVLTRL